MSTENSIPIKKDNINRISQQNNDSPDEEIITKINFRNKNSSNNEKYNIRASNLKMDGTKKNIDSSFKHNINSSLKERNINNTNNSIRKQSNNITNTNIILLFHV